MIAPIEKSHEPTRQRAAPDTSLHRFVFRWKCFAFGVGPMLHGGGEWLNWRRYVCTLRFEGPNFTALQFRLLWFYAGLRFKNHELIRLRGVLRASGLYEIECGTCERPLIVPIGVEPEDVNFDECCKGMSDVVANGSQQ